MRAAIYGAGSLGTILGAFISKKGGQIDLINHNEKHVEALRRNGAHVTRTMDFVQKVNALTDKEMTGLYDIIFLMTKQQGNIGASNRGDCRGAEGARVHRGMGRDDDGSRGMRTDQFS